jgi:hypothetical protein
LVTQKNQTQYQWLNLIEIWAEAWRKRRYEAAFVVKLNDCVRGACRRQAESAETQTWIEFTFSDYDQ